MMEKSPEKYKIAPHCIQIKQFVDCERWTGYRMRPEVVLVVLANMKALMRR
jgi:hypothetical protein